MGACVEHVYAQYMSELGCSKVVYQNAGSDYHKKVRFGGSFLFIILFKFSYVIFIIPYLEKMLNIAKTNSM